MERDAVIFHADDFAASEEISAHILDCCGRGALNSVSILPNSQCLETCMKMLEPYRGKIRWSIHFNLTEGHCVAKASQIPLLVDERGMFRLSFFRILTMSLFGKPSVKKALGNQIETEIKAQMDRMRPYGNRLRVDSHQHYHLIPVVLRRILKAAKERGKEIEFIRIPAEPITPFLRHPEFYLTYRPVNLVKNVVLNLLYQANRKRLKPYRKKSAVFFGIMLSGKMDLQRVSVLKPEFEKIAQKRGLPLEILCHPGGVERPDRLMDRQNHSCVNFYMAKERRLEKEMLQNI